MVMANFKRRRYGTTNATANAEIHGRRVEKND
jgi:hypothetical protein